MKGTKKDKFLFNPFINWMAGLPSVGMWIVYSLMVLVSLGISFAFYPLIDTMCILIGAGLFLAIFITYIIVAKKRTKIYNQRLKDRR